MLRLDNCNLDWAGLGANSYTSLVYGPASKDLHHSREENIIEWEINMNSPFLLQSSDLRPH